MNAGEKRGMVSAAMFSASVTVRSSRDRAAPVRAFPDGKLVVARGD